MLLSTPTAVCSSALRRDKLVIDNDDDASTESLAYKKEAFDTAAEESSGLLSNHHREVEESPTVSSAGKPHASFAMKTAAAPRASPMSFMDMHKEHSSTAAPAVASAPSNLSLLFAVASTDRSLKAPPALPPLKPSLSSSSSCTSSTTATTTATEVKEAAAATKHGPLKSAMRGGGGGRKTARAMKHVRGLWETGARWRGEEDATEEATTSVFAELHDELLTRIFSHLSLQERCSVARVCQRWKHLARDDDSAWTRVEATQWVQQVFDFNRRKADDSSKGEKQNLLEDVAAEATSSELARYLQPYAPQQLTIHSIGNRLAADHFHPSMKNLQELTLTHFDSLSDTHLHVMLLSVDPVLTTRKARSRPNLIRKLVLDHCPLLTNASVRFIAQQCPNLEELSMVGNQNIDDLTPLSNLYKVHKTGDLKVSPGSNVLGGLPKIPTPCEPSTKSSCIVGVRSSASMLFDPPAKRHSTPNLTSLFAPPPASATRSTHRAASASPPLLTRKSSTVSSLLTSSASPSLSTCLGGNLTRLSFANCSGITPGVVLKSLRDSPGARVVLTHLDLHWAGLTTPGNGDDVPSAESSFSSATTSKSTSSCWTDRALQRLSKSVHGASLVVLDLSVAQDSDTRGEITERGLQVLFPEDTSKGQLEHLGLQGHAMVPKTAIQSLLKK